MAMPLFTPDGKIYHLKDHYEAVYGALLRAGSWGSKLSPVWVPGSDVACPVFDATITEDTLALRILEGLIDPKFLIIKTKP